MNEGLEEIGEGAFSYTALEEINLPKGVKKIGAYAFSNCTKLMAIYLPEGLEEIEYGAFEGCNNITKIELPITIKKLSSSAFKFEIGRQYIVRGIPFNLSLGYDEDINFLEKGKWVEHIKLPNEDKEIIKQIILGLPEGKLKTDFWDKINIEKLNENIEMFRKLGIPKEKISNLFVNNIELISVGLDAIIENYNYLERQNVINSNDLQKLFFSSFNQSEINNLSGKNIEQQKEILKEFGVGDEAAASLITSISTSISISIL